MTKKANTPVKPAKKPPAFIEAPEPDPADKRSPLDREQDRQEQAIADVMAREKVQGGFIELSRRCPGEVNFGYLAKIPAETYSPENVRLIFGGGDYKMQIKTSDGKFRGHFELKVDYAIPAKHPEKPLEEKKENDVAAIIAAVTAAMKSNAPAPVAAAGPDPMMLEMMKGMFGMVMAMVAAKPTGPDPTVTAAIARIEAQVQTLKDGGGSGGGGLNGFLNNFSKIKELIADSIPEGAAGGGSSGGEEKPDRGMQALSLFAPLINAVGEKVLLGNQPVQQQAAAEPAAQPQLTNGQAATNGATPAAAIATPANGTAATQPKAPMITLFLPEFRRLAIAAASRNSDPFDWVADKLESVRAFKGQIFDLANKEEWFKEIFGTDPQAMKRMAWLLEMRNSILLFRFVAEAEKAFALQGGDSKTPEKFALDYIDGASVSSLDTLFDFTDPKPWDQLFPSTAIEAAWLEAVRVALDKELRGDDDDEKQEGDALDKVDQELTKEAKVDAAAGQGRSTERPPSGKKKG